MAKKNVNHNPENNQAVGEAVSGLEQFLKKNGNLLSTIVLVILIAVCAILALNRWVLKPAQQEARAAAAGADRYFEAAAYEQALNGDGNVLGFSQIIDDFGGKAGKDVYFYAGVCELQIGNYQQAIDYLKKYKGTESILKARAIGCMGDAYTGLENYKEALRCFDAAAAVADNMFAATYMLKAGVVCEQLGDNGKALTYYKTIKDKYPQSMEGYDIDKYISRIESQK